MSTQPSTARFELPKGTQEIVPIIEKRVRSSVHYHFFSIHTWTENKNDLFRLDAIEADVAIYVISRVLERLLHSGALVFQGIKYDFLHTKVLTQSVEGDMQKTYGRLNVFSKDLSTLIEEMLFRFLKKHHQLVKGDMRTLSIRRPRRPRASIKIGISATLH